MVRWHKLQWFLDRIGKRIYRRGGACRCEHCQKVLKEGLIVRDRQHANYLFDCQNKIPVRYSDKIPEGMK